MANPWLEVPLADYEGHMEYTGQARLLADVFGEAVRTVRPQSVAVLGAAGGNGFGHLIGGKIERTVALDLNSDYLRQLERRYRNHVQSLEVVCGDLNDPDVDFAPVAYVHAALVFEYVDARRALGRIYTWLHAQGQLGVVLQLPGASDGSVTPSPFASLAKLGSTMQLRDAASFRKTAAELGFRELACEVLTLPRGKQFYCARYTTGGPVKS